MKLGGVKKKLRELNTLKKTTQFNVITGVICLSILSIVYSYMLTYNSINVAQASNTTIKELTFNERVDKAVKRFVSETGAKEWEVRGVLAKESFGCNEPEHEFLVNVNRDGSIDRGCWMINAKYHETTNKCAFDLECSTTEAIKIFKGAYKRTGNGWTPWYGARVIGLW